MRRNLIFIRIFLLAAIFLIAGLASAGDNYPSKPIKMIVGFSAGGPTDVPARVISAQWEKVLGQPIVVTNKTGAGGQLAWDALAKAKPDGYMLGVVNVPGCNMVSLRPGAKFTVDDFDYIGCNIVDPAVIMVKNDSPYKSFQEIVAADKKKPGSVIVGLNGPTSDDQLAILMIEDAIGHKFISKVMYPEGEAKAAVALLGGHVHCMVGNASTYAKNPKDIRILTILNKTRMDLYPKVPTFKESMGVDVVEFSARGFGSPKGIPSGPWKKIINTFEKTVKSPKTIAELKKVGFAPVFWDSKEYGENVKMLDKMLKKYRKQLGL